MLENFFDGSEWGHASEGHSKRVGAKLEDFFSRKNPHPKKHVSVSGGFQTRPRVGTVDSGTFLRAQVSRRPHS